MTDTPRFTISEVPGVWDTTADLEKWSWDELPTLPAFVLADGSGPAEQQTVARLGYDATALYVRYECDDHDIWGTYSQRNEPIYDEEVVELFLAPGEGQPKWYYEFEVSPNGVLLDAKIHNPTGQRPELEVDVDWNCPGIRWRAERDEADGRWWAILVIPWAAVAPAGDLPRIWRANLYRIERPRNASPEFSCWSPTMTEPADFHKPAHFGTLVLG